jgi:hypothetical protein
MQACPTCNGNQTIPGDVCPALSYCPEGDTLLCILPDGSWDWSPHGSRAERLTYVGQLRSRRGLDATVGKSISAPAKAAASASCYSTPKPSVFDPAIVAVVAHERHGLTLCPRCSAQCTVTPQTTKDDRVQLRADCPTHGYVKFVAQR